MTEAAERFCFRGKTVLLTCSKMQQVTARTEEYLRVSRIIKLFPYCTYLFWYNKLKIFLNLLKKLPNKDCPKLRC